MKITIGENCFGTTVDINDKPIINYDDDCELNIDLVKIILNEILSFKDNLTKKDTHELMSTLYNHSNKFILTNEEFESVNKDDEESIKLMCIKIDYNNELIINEINNIKEELSIFNWRKLVSMILNHRPFEINKDDCYANYCEQCDSYNYSDSYHLKKDLLK